MTAPIAAPTRDAIQHAVAHLRAGTLVAFPTETVYGLGADAGNEQAVRRIFAAKGRPADHPVIVHVWHKDAAASWVREMPDAASRLADAFWPGPLTLIVPRSPRALDAVTAGQDSVGLRVPSHPVAVLLLREFAHVGGTGIAAPSANRFGRISPTTAQHVADDLGDDVAMILDGGACDVGIESTIVAFRDGEPMLLRPGGISLEELTRVLGRAPHAPASDAPRASGTLPSHYAPRTPARLVSALELRDIAGDVAVLARTVERPKDAKRWIDAARDPVHYAHDLYANLRSLDSMQADVIAIEAVPDDLAWQAVRDRLTRATAGDDDDRD